MKRRQTDDRDGRTVEKESARGWARDLHGSVGEPWKVRMRGRPAKMAARGSVDSRNREDNLLILGPCLSLHTRLHPKELVPSAQQQGADRVSLLSQHDGIPVPGQSVNMSLPVSSRFSPWRIVPLRGALHHWDQGILGHLAVAVRSSRPRPHQWSQTWRAVAMTLMIKARTGSS